MGLDMYLRKHTYLSRIDDAKRMIKHDGKEYKNCVEIVQEGMYWRKANEIHAWFVKNVQDGKDDCREYAVSFDKLEALNGIVSQILEKKGKEQLALAQELLPTQDGFFFGSTDYDGYYFDDLKRTAKELKTLIEEAKAEKANKDHNHAWFTYRSSW